MSDIESRRFTAILDVMEEHIDPEKIERARIANAKYRIESELVLMRDILPAVLAEIKKRYRIKFHIQLEPDQGNHRRRRSRRSLAALEAIAGGARGDRRQQFIRAIAGSSSAGQSDPAVRLISGLTKKKVYVK